ncbi:hypothetical protein SAMN04488544_0706 [Microlunatus sagamiharensis]|uniref:(2Fe-2S) ferredoxin n=1 Tax=Microlunatus sagamiharensis TaxID=546874 RepID=A0A1H2LSI6_9ACTN|nr:hypothetical protein [Microlunatus sagamiharensis]SDU83571.1 hypothetical protein SAMN04488544_0706 [Microlunatus sagamiharensis]
MSRRQRRRTPASDVDDRQVVVVCRGGDCGNRTKHPGFDHRAQLRRLRDEVDPGSTRVVSSTCLDACDHSNVVVVVPGTSGLERGGAAVWVGEVLDEATTAALVDWVGAGGPGVATEPVLVDLRAFRPSRLNRHELEEEIGRS